MYALSFKSLYKLFVSFLCCAALCSLLTDRAIAQIDYEVYSGNWSSLPNFNNLTPIATGQSDVIDLSVSTLTNRYALVFTKQLTVNTAANYDFEITSDDGTEVRVNGTRIINNDGIHTANTMTAQIFLTAGTHDLRIEYFESTGAATLDFRYRIENGLWRPIPPDGVLNDVIPTISEIGSWGPVIAWPEIAISAATMPDGKVLTWSSTEIDDFPDDTEFSHASVFDPATTSFVSVDNNFHDMFCAGVTTMQDGTIIASGGNREDRRTSAFDFVTQSWSALADMNDERWYSTNVFTANNKVFATYARGSGNRGEIYDPATNSWSLTANTSMQTLLDEQTTINAESNPSRAVDLQWLSHLALTPNGKVFQGGPTPTWHLFDPVGGAALQSLGQPIGTRTRSFGNAVNYAPGKVMLIGGADFRQNVPVSKEQVYLVDLTTATPTVTTAAPMLFGRALSNAVTLPNGNVLVIGGNKSGKLFSDEISVMNSEIYNPATDSWTLAAPISIPRNYHSTALLLKDATVLSAGGGGCGTDCVNENHLDGQIYSPPYLFDNLGGAATRPTITASPSQAIAGSQITVSASSDTTEFSMVRLSATTHHLNTDHRFLPIASTNNGDGTFTLSLESNPNVLLLGYYWVFALNADGTPSIGENLQIVTTLPPIAPTNDVYISDMTWVSEINGLGAAERDLANGAAAAQDGGLITLAGTQFEKGVGTHAGSEIVVQLAGHYDQFRSVIGLDDEADGTSGSVVFEVQVDGLTVYTSAIKTDISGNETINIDVTGANQLKLIVSDAGDGSSSDSASWADAKLTLPPGVGFRYYRFTPTKLRDPAADSVQLSEFSIFDAGLRLFPTTASNVGGNNPTGNEADKASDNLTSTKWRDLNSLPLTYDYGVATYIDGYDFTTADDQDGRDPVQWLLEGSADGSNWIILDDQTGQDFATPLARETAIGEIAIDLGPPLDVVSPLPAQPRNSSTLLVDNSGASERIWIANPDNASVSIVDDQGNLLQEIFVGERPWSIAQSPNNDKIYVTEKGNASISIINPSSYAIESTVTLPTASEPHGVVFDATGSHYYIVLEALQRVDKYNATNNTLVASALLSGTPRHLAMAYDDSHLYISNFITPPISGESGTVVDVATAVAEVFVVDPSTMALDSTSTLSHDDRVLTESQGPGMPNYLHTPIISFDNAFAYIPSKKDNVGAGPSRGAPGMTFESTVRAHASRLTLSGGLEDSGFSVDFDNSSVATGAALTGDNRYLLVSLETSREVAIYDTVNNFPLMRLDVGRAPQAVALSSDGSIAYVHNFMDRSLSRFDLTDMLQQHLPIANPLPTVSLVTTEALSSSILNGKQLFYDAQDNRLARDDYMSCASCHNDGGQDGRVWDLSGLGEGVRNTISLRGTGGRQGILHWSANFDEVHDFENQIRSLGLGDGLLSNADFVANQDPLGTPKAGLSSDLDDLAAYVNSLTTLPDSPYRANPLALGTTAMAGQQTFIDAGCIACHSGATLGNESSVLNLQDVGTITAASGNRAGLALTGLDAPALVGAWQAPPYLHDGSASTVLAAIEAHSTSNALTTQQKTELVEFLNEANETDAALMIDSDGDGAYDFAEQGDSDGDGLQDYLESSIVDSDGDGVPDQLDANNSDPCIPSSSAAACGVNIPMLAWPHLLAFLIMVVGIVKARRALSTPSD